MIESKKIILESSRERIFIEEQRKQGDGIEREENWRRGLTPEEELHP